MERDIGLPPPSSPDINLVTIARGGEQFIFLYRKSLQAELLRIAESYVKNPELFFERRDKARLVKEVLQSERE